MQSVSVAAYLSKLDQPILDRLIVRLDARRIAHHFFGKKPDLSELQTVSQAMIKEYQRSSYINGCYLKKTIRDDRGRFWEVWPTERSDGLYCHLKARKFKDPVMTMDDYGQDTTMVTIMPNMEGD